MREIVADLFGRSCFTSCLLVESLYSLRNYHVLQRKEGNQFSYEKCYVFNTRIQNY